MSKYICNTWSNNESPKISSLAKSSVGLLIWYSVSIQRFLEDFIDSLVTYSESDTLKYHNLFSSSSFILNYFAVKLFQFHFSQYCEFFFAALPIFLLHFHSKMHSNLLFSHIYLYFPTQIVIIRAVKKDNCRVLKFKTP